MSITSSQWLDTDTGFVVTISDTKVQDQAPANDHSPCDVCVK